MRVPYREKLSQVHRRASAKPHSSPNRRSSPNTFLGNLLDNAFTFSLPFSE